MVQTKFMQVCMVYLAILLLLFWQLGLLIDSRSRGKDKKGHGNIKILPAELIVNCKVMAAKLCRLIDSNN